MRPGRRYRRRGRCCRPRRSPRRFPVDFRWRSLPGAANYRIQIRALDAEGAVLGDELTEINGFSSDRLGDGRFEVRVRGIDGQGLEGEDGRLVFTLDARPEAPIPIAPKLGATVRSELPEFEWSRPLEADSYHFQLAADADFSELVTDLTNLNDARFKPQALQPGAYFWRIATRAGQEEGPFSRTQEFVLRPAPQAPDVSAEGSEEQLALRWQAGLPEQRYRIQLGKDAEFREIVEDRLLDAPDVEMQRPHEPIFFRVRVVDIDGYQGGWSSVHQIDPPPQPWWLMLIPFGVLLL